MSIGRDAAKPEIVSDMAPNRTLRQTGIGSSVAEATMSAIKNNVPPFLVLAIIWEIIVRAKIFPPVLMPSIEKIAETGWTMMLSGELFLDLFASVARLLIGFLIGGIIGIVLGLVMGQVRLAEKFFLPLISALMPIPSLAWVPLFILWFGLGSTTILSIIIFSVALPVAFNTWTGVKSVNPIWIRAAESMRCRGVKLFARVIFPASLTMVFAGLRIGLSQGWRALVAGEMLAGAGYGLGYAIFNAREFLATDVMLVMVILIGFIGFFFVVVLFSLVEKYTIVRWGMLKGDLGA